MTPTPTRAHPEPGQPPFSDSAESFLTDLGDKLLNHCVDEGFSGEDSSIYDAVRLAYRKGHVAGEASGYLKRQREEGETWTKLIKPDLYLAVTEGETYLFAIQCSVKGAPYCWEYFSDSIVWDAETAAQWGDGCHGWDINDELWFKPLPTPPALSAADSSLPQGREPCKAAELTERAMVAERQRAELRDGVDALRSECARLAQELAEAKGPVAMYLTCPECMSRHIDEGEFATKVHHTHACQTCGHVWRPAVIPTVGVQFLPGFKNEPQQSPSSHTPSLIEQQGPINESEATVSGEAKNRLYEAAANPAVVKALVETVQAATRVRSWYDKQMGPEGPEDVFDAALSRLADALKGAG